MGIKLFSEPQLKNPVMIACWPGIANIGLVAVDTLKNQIQAEELGEIEPWDFFYPIKAIIKDGILENLEFPRSHFYYKTTKHKDIIVFIGDEQPSAEGSKYAEGQKAYQTANMVLDVAERFGCRRIYTSGAAVALSHHTMKPRVWAVTSSPDLFKEVSSQNNTIFMSEVEGRNKQGNITGLNGLLLGVAKSRGFESICLMGEIPDYLTGIPFPFPLASKSVLEVLTSILGIDIDYSSLNNMTLHIDRLVDGIYERFPPEIQQRIEQRKTDVQFREETITEEDERWIKDHIDELFIKGGGGDERAS